MGLRQDTADSTAGLSEIIVTAQKREQNVQDVPISVIALSAQQLKGQWVTDIKIWRADPGLTVTSTTSETSPRRAFAASAPSRQPGSRILRGIVIDASTAPQRSGLRQPRRTTASKFWRPAGELFGKNNDAGVITLLTSGPLPTFGVPAKSPTATTTIARFPAPSPGPSAHIGISPVRRLPKTRWFLLRRYRSGRTPTADSIIAMSTRYAASTCSPRR